MIRTWALFWKKILHSPINYPELCTTHYTLWKTIELTTHTHIHKGLVVNSLKNSHSSITSHWLGLPYQTAAACGAGRPLPSPPTDTASNSPRSLWIGPHQHPHLYSYLRLITKKINCYVQVRDQTCCRCQV